MKLLIPIGILLATSYFFSSTTNEEKIPEDVKLVRQITAKTAKKLKQQKNLFLVEIGTQMMDEIEMLAMSFFYYQELPIQEVRKLLTYATNEYLSDINDNQEIRPYLKNYPFNTKNVEIVIHFLNPDGSYVANGKITTAEASEGKIIYYADISQNGPLKTLYQETYEEAMQIVSSSP